MKTHTKLFPHMWYQHFKGNYYFVVNESHPLDEATWNDYSRGLHAWCYYHEHTETGLPIETLYRPNGKVYHKESQCPDIMVAYIAYYGERKRYMRPKQMFLSFVDRCIYPEYAPGTPRFKCLNTTLPPKEDL